MIRARPNAILSKLVEKFGADFDGEMTREEMHLAGRLQNILEQSRDYGIEVDFEMDVVAEDDVGDADWNCDDFVIQPTELDGLADTDFINFGDRMVPLGEVKKAIEYYRGAKSGFRSLASMNNSYRFIKEKHHLKKLREVEDQLKSGELRMTRLAGLSKIVEKLHEWFKKNDEEGKQMDDLAIQQHALQLNSNNKYVKSFKACLSWVNSFKKSKNIVNRHVTKFVSKKNLVEAEKLLEIAEDFREKVQHVVQTEKIPWENVWNADQSGIQRNLVKDRTLTYRGAKKVERMVHSVSARTHSFTVMPIVTASGQLIDKLFIVLNEQKGKFPKTKPVFDSANIHRCANTTHIMNKELLGLWLETCVIPFMPDKLLLLVDSWTSFKDIQFIQSKVPSNKKLIVMNIPAGTTSMIQPLDLNFFQQFKKLIKHITNFAFLHDIQWLPQQRDPTLQMTSVVFRQFQAGRFQEYLKYGWYKGGYIDHPNQYETPPQYCLKFDASAKCSIQLCNEYGFVRCAWCQQIICFTHFIIEPHLTC